MNHDLFMRRCIELASNGLGSVSPNPMTGCVIVHDNKIIGEGYHQKYGEAHAEVNAIRQAESKYGKDILSRSTLYVSLEPCNHFGKTPPCCDLILEKKIPKIVVGCIDSSEKVNGSGIKRLKESGCEVIVGILEKDCRDLNKRFFTFHEKHRPYIILKYAQSKDGFIAPLIQNENNRWISNEYARKIVHQWRSEEQSIMIGTKTALIDNPFLTIRNWKGNNPIRMVIDRLLTLLSDLNIFDSSAPTLIFNEKKTEKKNNLEWIAVSSDENQLNEIMNQLYKREIQSLTVEGGANLLQKFIDQNLWEEARIFTGNILLKDGVKAPLLKDFEIVSRKRILEDELIFMKHV